MQQGLDEATDPWGVLVERVEVKDVRVPENLQRAMAAEAEAAREARAKVIAAEGEHKASRALRHAAEVSVGMAASTITDHTPGDPGESSSSAASLPPDSEQYRSRKQQYHHLPSAHRRHIRNDGQKTPGLDRIQSNVFRSNASKCNQINNIFILINVALLKLPCQQFSTDKTGTSPV